MSHHQAKTSGARPKGPQRCGGHQTAVPLAAVLAALALALVSCTPAAGRGTHLPETSVTVIATAAPVPATTPKVLVPRFTPTMPGYRLVFDDEFDGPSVSEKRWTASLAWGNTNRDEQQYYTPAALSQRDGVLTITARQQPSHGEPYTSGAINSSKGFSFKYGYAETRAQVPAGAGLWSAFWIVSPVPRNTDEVDIMEVVGSDPSKGYAVLHYGTSANGGRSLGTYRNPDFSAGFHTFAVDWDPNRIVWYVDGVERYRVTENIPRGRMYCITNLAIGGPNSWSGPPNRYTEFPAHMKIDYIRVFQRE